MYTTTLATRQHQLHRPGRANTSIKPSRVALSRARRPRCKRLCTFHSWDQDIFRRLTKIEADKEDKEETVSMFMFSARTVLRVSGACQTRTPMMAQTTMVSSAVLLLLLRRR